MLESNKEHYRQQAIKCFAGLQSLGCSLKDFLGSPQCQFDGLNKPVKLTIKQVGSFARLIRMATNLEKQGILIADIDRMGRVIGWHIKKG